MTELSALWLPILLSAVLVFVASSVIHMMLPWHRADYPKLPNQDQVMDALRPFNIPPGDYMVPRAEDPKEMGSPEFQAKLERGPVVVMTVMPAGKIAMGKNLLQWFIFSLIVSLLAAYIAGAARPPMTEYLEIFRFTGATAFIGYAVALWPMSIWYKRSWGTTVRATVDGLIYGLLTGGVFGWLWPQ